MQWDVTQKNRGGIHWKPTQSTVLCRMLLDSNTWDKSWTRFIRTEKKSQRSHSFLCNTNHSAKACPKIVVSKTLVDLKPLLFRWDTAVHTTPSRWVGNKVIFFFVTGTFHNLGCAKQFARAVCPGYPHQNSIKNAMAACPKTSIWWPSLVNFLGPGQPVSTRISDLDCN